MIDILITIMMIITIIMILFVLNAIIGTIGARRHMKWEEKEGILEWELDKRKRIKREVNKEDKESKDMENSVNARSNS